MWARSHAFANVVRPEALFFSDCLLAFEAVSVCLPMRPTGMHGQTDTHSLKG